MKRVIGIRQKPGTGGNLGTIKKNRRQSHAAVLFHFLLHFESALFQIQSYFIGNSCDIFTVCRSTPAGVHGITK